MVESMVLQASVPRRIIRCGEKHLRDAPLRCCQHRVAHPESWGSSKSLLILHDSVDSSAPTPETIGRQTFAKLATLVSSTCSNFAH
jgi:hypothetical protein